MKNFSKRWLYWLFLTVLLAGIGSGVFSLHFAIQQLQHVTAKDLDPESAMALAESMTASKGWRTVIDSVVSVMVILMTTYTYYQYRREAGVSKFNIWVVFIGSVVSVANLYFLPAAIREMTGYQKYILKNHRKREEWSLGMVSIIWVISFLTTNTLNYGFQLHQLLDWDYLTFIQEKYLTITIRSFLILGLLMLMTWYFLLVYRSNRFPSQQG